MTAFASIFELFVVLLFVYKFPIGVVFVSFYFNNVGHHILLCHRLWFFVLFYAVRVMLFSAAILRRLSMA